MVSAETNNGCRAQSSSARIRGQTGSAAVEFAIIAPVFILMLVGMLAFGIYLSATHSIRQLSADAARASIPGLTEEERKQLATAFVAQSAHRYAFIDPEYLVVTVKDDEEHENRFDVELRYDSSELPIWSLAAITPLPGKTIVGVTTIQNGGV